MKCVIKTGFMESVTEGFPLIQWKNNFWFIEISHTKWCTWSWKIFIKGKYWIALCYEKTHIQTYLISQGVTGSLNCITNTFIWWNKQPNNLFKGRGQRIYNCNLPFCSSGFVRCNLAWTIQNQIHTKSFTWFKPMCINNFPLLLLSTCTCRYFTFQGYESAAYWNVNLTRLLLYMMHCDILQLPPHLALCVFSTQWNSQKNLCIQ